MVRESLQSLRLEGSEPAHCHVVQDVRLVASPLGGTKGEGLVVAHFGSGATLSPSKGDAHWY